MSGKNAQNENSVQKNAKTPLNHSERMKRFKAKLAKKKQTLRVPNSGKFEHLRKFLESYRQNETAYNKIMRQKTAQEMAQQNHKPKTETVIEQVNELKTETEVRIENNSVVEEPKAKEELPNSVDEVVKENDAKPMNLEDITVDDVDLEDPALDKELEELEQKIKKEEELKAMGLDPNSVEEPDDPELDKEISELVQEPDEKLEGAALEEAFQSLSNEVDSEIKGSDADDHEIDDPDVDEDINRLEGEIKKEESKPTEQSEPIAEEERLIATEKPPVIPRKPIEPESIFAKNPAHRTVEPEKKSLDAKYDLRYNFQEAKLKKIFFKEGELSRGNVISEAYEENDIIEAEYDIEEIEHKINEKDTVISHRVSIPNFDDLLAQRRENQEATSQVVRMLSDILNEAGITDLQNEPSLAEAVYQKLSGTMENNTLLSGKDSVMHDVAVTFFDESYNALDNSGLSSVDRVVAAQRIANVMMSGYSPLGFVYGELDKYTDNYVMTNSALLERRLMENGKFSEAEAETLVDGVMSRLDDDSARLQAEFEAKYGKGLTAEDELRIYVPDFHKKYDARIDDELFAENVKKQIGDILRSSGIAKKEDTGGDEESNIDEVINETVDSIYDDTVRNIRLMYDYNSVGSTISYMTNWNYETTLKALNEGTMLPRNPIVTAQRISDVILKSYTPIAFAENGALNRYANNYIIQNKDYLKGRLEAVQLYSEKEIEDILQRNLMAELRQELKEGTQMEQQNAQPQEQQLEQIQEQQAEEPQEQQLEQIQEQQAEEPQELQLEQIQEQQAEEPQELQLEQIQEHIKKLEEIETFSFDESDPLSYESAYIKDVVSDNPQPEPLYSVSELIEMRIAHPDIYEEVNSQLNDILKSAGSVLADKPRSVGVIHDVMSKTMLSAFDADRESIDMTDVAAAFFKNAYAGINGEDWSLKDKVINAQRIADLMLKNYSPIPIVGGDLQRFADNYVLKNKEMYRTLQIARNDEIDSLFEDVQKELAGVSEINEQANDQKESDGPLPFESFAEFCEALYVQRMSYSNNALHESVKSQMTDILKETGSSLLDDPGFIEAFHHNMAAVMHSSYPLDGPFPEMEDVAVQFFANAYQFISQDNLSTKDKIITAQRLSDLALSHYSPVTFAKDERLDQYAQLFVINYAPRLKDILEAKGVDKEAIQAMEAIANEKDELVSIPLEIEQSEPMMDEQIENKENVAIQFDEITEINVEEHKEPTLADDFELMRNNSPESEVDSNPIQNMNNEQHVENPEEESLKPSIPDFYQNLGERMDSADITAQVMSEIKDIIKETGISDETRVAELSDASYSFVKKQINSIYDKETVPETKMSKDAPTFFRNAYESLIGSGLNTQVQIIAAQKIANVMLKNYSPVAFIEEGLEHYTNDYVLNNRDEFKSQLDMLRLYNVEALMDEVDAARGIYHPIENEETEFTRWLNGRIESTAVYDSVYNELSDIFKNAGLVDPYELSELVKFTQYYGSRTIIDSPHLDGDNPNMHDIAVQFFEDSYQMIESAGLSQKDRIITAQKISDVMLKNYSPVATEREKFEQYSNNYVLGNTTLLRELLEKLEVQNIDTLINDRDIASASGPENKIPDMINGAELRENPRDFMLDRVRNEKAITNICNILVEAGIAEDAAQNLEVGDILEDAYSKKNIPDASISMRDVAKNIFVTTYDALTKKELAPNNKIETVQKIADVILKNYSPIIRNKALDKYAQNYVTGDKNLLGECLVSLNVPENEIKAIVGDVKPEVKPEVKPAPNNENMVNEDKKADNQKALNTEDRSRHKTAQEEKEKQISDSVKGTFFTNRLNTFSSMYRINVDANDFVFAISEAWTLMKSGDAQKNATGQKVMGDLFKNILQSSFEVERNASYNEHRIPEFNDIIKSTNELFRSAMFAFTDLYHDPKSASLFDATSYGGLNAKDMAGLTAGDSLWKMDQKSDEAWEIQSREAKNLADQWLKESKPYEKMINEMNSLIESGKNGTLDMKQTYAKLTAAEWLLVNNEKMMVEDPEDPLNPIPNWGNRYWKALTAAREAVGISKHTSMRDLIQSDYAEIAKAAVNTHYNEKQIQDYVLDPEVREIEDSLESQKEEFTTQSRDVVIKESPKVKAGGKEIEAQEDYIRKREPVESEDQRAIMKNEPKIYSNRVVDKENELKKDSVRGDLR